MDVVEYQAKRKLLLLVNCDLIHGTGRKVYTLIHSMIYGEHQDVLACNVPAEECEGIPFTFGSKGFMEYTEISHEHRVANLPLVPWYKRKLSYVPENGSVLLT